MVDKLDDVKVLKQDTLDKLLDSIEDHREEIEITINCEGEQHEKNRHVLMLVYEDLEKNGVSELDIMNIDFNDPRYSSLDKNSMESKLIRGLVNSIQHGLNKQDAGNQQQNAANTNKSPTQASGGINVPKIDLGIGKGIKSLYSKLKNGSGTQSFTSYDNSKIRDLNKQAKNICSDKPYVEGKHDPAFDIIDKHSRRLEDVINNYGKPGTNPKGDRAMIRAIASVLPNALSRAGKINGKKLKSGESLGSLEGSYSTRIKRIKKSIEKAKENEALKDDIKKDQEKNANATNPIEDLDTACERIMEMIRDLIDRILGVFNRGRRPGSECTRASAKPVILDATG
jgi:hypothetical protein